MLAVITVNTDQDIFDPVDKIISLREAIVMANLIAGSDQITFELGQGEPATIQLEQGELELTDAVTITGPGRELLTIDARHQSRIFNITAGQGDFVINGLTLTNGRNRETSRDRSGGALRSNTQGMLAIDNVSVRDSDAPDGGAISARNVTITSSTISGNSAASGGGISAETANITSSTIAGNSAVWSGGGVRVSKNATITSSTISGNSATSGGAISASGDIAMSFSTVAANSTIGQRWDCPSGAIDGDGRLSIDHTIVAANRGGDIRHVSIEARHSLIGDNRGTQLVETAVGVPDANGNLVGGAMSGLLDPGLAPLADNGGATLTHAIFPGSPAINGGNSSAVAGVNDAPMFDQRGESHLRVVGGRLDIGAYERQALTATISRIPSPAMTPVSEVTIEFTKPMSGFDMGDLRLTRNGDVVELLDTASLNRVNDQVYTLSGLADSTSVPGYYTLALIPSGAEIQAMDSSPLDAGFSTGWASRPTLGLTVDTLVDELDGRIDDGDVSLRDALAFAAPGETINFAPSLNGGTLALKLGAVSITRAVTVDASSLDKGLVIDGSENVLTRESRDAVASHVFRIVDGNVLADSPVTLRRLTIWGNDTDSGGSAIFTEESLSIEAGSISGSNADGGIYSLADVSIDSSTISGNKGAGVYAVGSVAVHASEISRNQGSGIDAHDATITSSTISDNKGSGISVSNNHYECLFSDNEGRTVDVQNSTISGNHDGGIIAGSVTVSSSTIVENSIEIGVAPAFGIRWDFGGGIDATGDIVVANSIVARNLVIVSCWCEDSLVDSYSDTLASDLQSLSQITVRHSLIGDIQNTGLQEAPVGTPDVNGNLIGGSINGAIDPRLAPLRDNGGPNFTHALLSDSPAINMGDPSAVIAADDIPPFDQRGEPYSRVTDGRIDMGAFESRAVGDSNGDGAFDALDLVFVCEAGKYEDDLANNATFDEGDWNGDGDFDRYDVVFALQAGNYLSAATPPAAVAANRS